MAVIAKYISDCKENLKKRHLKRVGYCCQCGDCCKYAAGMEFFVDNLKKFKVNKYEKRQCDNYNPKRKMCKRHKNKKWICKCWPMIPEHIKEFPRCTYRFEKC